MTRRQPWDLHDATLLSVVFDWQTATVVLEFAVGRGARLRLVSTGVRHLECPRQLPWGESVSVNVVWEDSSESTLTVEMQSGDEIRIAAAAFELERDGQ